MGSIQQSAVLITGGTGFIGSFTALAFLEAGYKVIIVDNLVNSSIEVVNRIEMICGKRPYFYKIDVTDEKALDCVFSGHPDIECVIHFAGLKSLTQAIKDPIAHYHANVNGTLAVLRCMEKYRVRTLLFSSSSTVYGDITLQPDMVPVHEDCPLVPENPYGHTKVMGEIIIKDFINARNQEEKAAGSGKLWNAGLLRYFNPCGSHPSGILGEDPNGGLHLIPFLAYVALGKLPKLGIYGGDFDTRDGTMIRDYIHVLDLGQGHLAALNYLKTANPGVRAWNFGSGKGSTVLEAAQAFSKASGCEIPTEITPRRPGYVPDLTADTTRAEKELKWTAVQTLEECCRSFWVWTTNNPEGYAQDPPVKLIAALQEKKSLLV